MKRDLPKIYEPQKVEDGIYKRWEESGCFNPDNLEGDPYSIMMPPPNVTGVLHLGHALENSLMDLMARFQRMQGKKVLLLPGTDHAAVATQAKVEKILIKKGIEHPREELGREKLLEEIRKFAENSKSTILKQIRKMGTSCDWSRLAYTFDEKRSRAVNEVFVRMFNDGLIYRGYRVVNWSVKGQSTCSDDELEYKERTTKLYTFRYAKDFPIPIATTRPETKLGDTAVAVNPNDKRYKKFIEQTFTAEVGAAKPLEIKIIADENVDINFGTGAVGVTPAHSAIDFEMYEKQKSLGNPIKLIPVIDEQGKMNQNAGKYAGLPAEVAREKFVAWLKENDLLEKEEEITHSVGMSDRFGDVVEALPMTQWFVDVNKKIPDKEKSLKELMRDAVAIGHGEDSAQKITITPDRFVKTYFNWIENLRDWCISRQIWWGHRIPVWYKNEKIYCAPQAPQEEGWEQDTDTLDTWFSSGLWTFSTLGWPDKEWEKEKLFHPTNWMQMGHEILFFWMARMILMSTYAIDQIPFKDVYIHGILRDEKGQKFSKSLGNTLDPIAIIEKYGADSLRLSLVAGVSPGNDSRFYEEKVESSRNFVNKLWNIARYVLISYPADKHELNTENLLPSDVWILQKFSSLIKNISNDIKNFQLSQAAEKLREFTWSEFADWYLEIAKFEENKDVKNWILNNILEDLMRMWHPFIPFVTETIWNESGKKTMLIAEKWPSSDKYEIKAEKPKHENYLEYFEFVRETIVAIRNIRIENKLDLKKKLTVVIRLKTDSNPLLKEVFEHEKEIIKKLRTGVGELTIEISDDIIEDAYHFPISDGNLYVLRAGLVDVEKEKARVEKEIANIEKFVAGLKSRLENNDFVSKAPKNVIDQQKESLAKKEAELVELKKHLSSLK